MDSLTATILAVMAQTAISGLYRKEQLKIGVQEAHKRRPDLSDDALLELAKEIHGFSRDGVARSAFGHERSFKFSFICFLLYIISLKQLHSSFYSPKSCRIQSN